ncbi:MAG: TIR domain-containing protein [Alphaproteobacteria bacterium]|nr:TIR domain-containing protein [Alphaproteobacteria bacterium]MBL6936908.1 TIR domain-containing protein [Alphaproteobacteria bacterium]MBL7097677.1 TIR domain-containing protein [Alphaproteobacteria bacterium]
MAHDVFLSYSSKDREIAEAACAALEARGITVWIAPRDILPGGDWSVSIIHAIADARVFVLVFSDHANTSQQIKREVERAVNRGIPVVPVRVEDVRPTEALEYFISTPHWLDAFPPPMEKHMAYLGEVVAGILRGSQEPVPRREHGAVGPAAPRLPLPTLPNRGLLLGIAATVLILLLAGGGWWFFIRSDEAEFPVECLAKVSEPTPAACLSMLQQNAAWQDCTSTFASQDMDRAASRATRRIDNGAAASELYYDKSFYSGAYGSISHYWEMFSECVVEGDLKFDQLSGSVPFPQVFWTRTHPLRQTFLSNWSGKNAPLPDFMENFQKLCLRYKQERNLVRPGSGDALDCSL